MSHTVRDQNIDRELYFLIQVYVDSLTNEDMQFIGDSIFPNIDNAIISKMVQFSNRVSG